MEILGVVNVQQPLDYSGILLGLAAMLTAAGGTYAIIKKKDPNTDVANRSAVAVSEIVSTSTKVDTLLSIVTELKDKIDILQRQRDLDAQLITKLQGDLKNEQVRHEQTLRELAAAQADLVVKDEKIATLQAQLDSLTKK